ncbi:MAG TPA: hypothetical protein VI942_13505 [Thermoanaerobaculia bacterium]|nr:hypothetical protein [Thermoanaerobaculia bacterium]
MAEVVRRIGLSLGADICWPICFEQILKRLDLALPVGGETVRFEVERLSIEPFDLRQPVKYDVVVDRLTHWYNTSREWIKKAVVMNDTYVFNNPWSIQSNEKHTSYCAMMRLGLPIPETWLVPPKEYEPAADLQVTLERYAKLFDLGEVGRKVGFPLFIKPYDGGAWVGVSKIENEEELRKAYDGSGKRLMHLQRAVQPFDLFVRALGVGPQVNLMKYEPGAPLHDRYKVAFDFLTPAERQTLADMCLTINAFFGWDFNSCESLRQDGVFRPIDFANACPDSQVTSLHFHFPWLVKAKLKWAIFVAATKRKVRRNLDWTSFFEIADGDAPFAEKLPAYARIARQRLDSDRFDEFCATRLAHLDEVAWEFFGTDVAKDAVRQKVTALFPAHEIEQFTEHFWGLVQLWRKTDGEARAAAAS